MKWQFDTVFDIKLFFVTGVYMALGDLGGMLSGNLAALFEATWSQVQGRGSPGRIRQSFYSPAVRNQGNPFICVG